MFAIRCTGACMLLFLDMCIRAEEHRHTTHTITQEAQWILNTNSTSS